MFPNPNAVQQLINWFNQLPPYTRDIIRDESLKILFGQSEILEFAQEIGEEAVKSLQTIVRTLSEDGNLKLEGESAEKSIEDFLRSRNGGEVLMPRSLSLEESIKAYKKYSAMR